MRDGPRGASQSCAATHKAAKSRSLDTSEAAMAPMTPSSMTSRRCGPRRWPRRSTASSSTRT
eukprot:8166318-Lingulodinium_polyedra.AAC.1